MAISLYELSVPTYLQTLDAVGGFLAKGLAHCREHGIDPEEIVATRVFPDMLPFHFQVLSVAFHAQAGVEAILTGAMSPPGARPQRDYAGLQALVAGTAAALRSVGPNEVEARAGHDVVFTAGATVRTFTAPEFLLSFSLPNLHFHATTAYGILRAKGVPLGKRDYAGAYRLKS